MRKIQKDSKISFRENQTLMKHIKKQFKIGDHYIDCGYIPRIVISIDYEIRKIGKLFRFFPESLTGRSLIDGNISSCSIKYCAPEWVHKGIAQRWAKTGPLSESLKNHIKAFYAGEWGNGRKIWWTEE